MLIRNFRRITSLKFNLTETKFILNPDFFERQDLIEAFKILLGHKKATTEALIKWTELDTTYNSRITKMIVVPSVIDFQKDFLTGAKGLFKELLTEVSSVLEMQNSSLIEIQNLLFNFKLENELPVFGELLKKVRENIGWEGETYFPKTIAQVIIDHYILEFTRNGEKITDNNISLIDLKKLYLYFLECLGKCSNENLLVVFDNPLEGVNYSEMRKIMELVNEFKNKIVIASYLPQLKDEDLPNLCLWNKDWFKDFSEIFDDLENYQKFVNASIEEIISPTLQEFQKLFSLYDKNPEHYINAEAKDKEILWKVIINEI